MKRSGGCITRWWQGCCCLLLIALLAACGEKEFHYPSVQLEFVTVVAGNDGTIQMLIPDKGDALPVLEDHTESVLSPNTSSRVLSNYEVVSEGVNIYSLQSLVTPLPKPESDPLYKEGIKCDPAEVVSIWMGRDHLNMILNLKVSTGMSHSIGMVEDTSSLETDGVVTLLLYHDAGGDAPIYNRRAYVSVPLMQYADAVSDRSIKIKFKYCTYDEKGAAVMSDKYINPGFDYLPTRE